MQYCSGLQVAFFLSKLFGPLILVVGNTDGTTHTWPFVV